MYQLQLRIENPHNDDFPYESVLIVPHGWWWTLTLSSALDGVSCHRCHQSDYTSWKSSHVMMNNSFSSGDGITEQRPVSPSNNLQVLLAPLSQMAWRGFYSAVSSPARQGWTHLTIRGKHTHILPVLSFHIFYFQKSRFQVTEVVLYRPLATKGIRTHSYLSLSYISRLPGAGNSFLLHNLGLCRPLVRALQRSMRGEITMCSNRCQQWQMVIVS